MGNRTELSRGDVRRNDRRRRLRELVARDRAVCGIDLADEVQELVVVDHDGAVLGRRGLSDTRAWQLEPALVWARRRWCGPANRPRVLGSMTWWWRASRPDIGGGSTLSSVTGSGSISIWCVCSAAAGPPRTRT